MVMAGMISGGKAETRSTSAKKTPGFIVLATVTESSNDDVKAKVKEILVWDRESVKDNIKKDARIIKRETKQKKPKVDVLFPKANNKDLLHIEQALTGNSAKVRDKNLHALIHKRVEVVLAKDKKTVLAFEEISTARLAKRKLTPLFGDARPAVHENHVEVANDLWTGEVKEWSQYKAEE